MLQVKRRVQISLVVCLLALGGFLVAYLVFQGNEVYILLTAATTAMGALAWMWSTRRPAQALQVFWWSALVVIACMVAVDMRTYASAGFPAVVAIPPVATILLRLLIGVRPSAFYAVGVFALLIPTGAVYGDWFEIGILAVLVVVAVTVSRRGDSSVVLAVLSGMEASTKRAVDEITATPATDRN